MATEKLKIGSELPGFELMGIDGKYHSPDSLFAKEALVIFFSCNHCPYVQAYEERIKNLQKEYSDKITFAAISSNDSVSYPEDSFEEMIKRGREKQLNFPYLYDESQNAARSFGATHTPEIFLFDKHRKLVFHGKIDDNWQDENLVRNRYLKNAIDELLAGKQISVPETFTIGCTIKWKSQAG
jgi:peroxiredoxin